MMTIFSRIMNETIITALVSTFVSSFIVWVLMRHIVLKIREQLRQKNEEVDRLADELVDLTKDNAAMEIVNRGGALYDKFVGLYEDILKIGEYLKKTQTSYDSAVSKIKDGKGNLLRQVEDLKSLGAKAQKSLPPADLTE